MLFSNEGFSGGFVAEYADTDVSYTAMNGTSTESNVAQMSTDLAGLWSNPYKSYFDSNKRNFASENLTVQRICKGTKLIIIPSRFQFRPAMVQSR